MTDNEVRPPLYIILKDWTNKFTSLSYD